MRLRYLKMALLAGAFAVNAPTNSARLLVAQSSTSDRDEVQRPRSIRAQTLTGFDDEERKLSRQSFTSFVRKTLKSSAHIHDLLRWGGVIKLKKQREIKTPVSEIFDQLKVGAVEGNLLADASWIKWAFYVHLFSVPSKTYVAIADAMLKQFNIVALAKKLIDAAAISETREIAEKLLEVLDNKGYAHEIESVRFFKKLRLKLTEHNFFESQPFQIWSKYLTEHGGKQYAKDPFGTEVEYFSQFYSPGNLLKMLTSPSNTDAVRSHEYLEKLKAHWLAEKVPPSEIVSLLALDKSQDHLFLSFDKNGPSLVVFKEYWKQFYLIHPLIEKTMMQTLTNAFGYARVVTQIETALDITEDDTAFFASEICHNQFVQWKNSEKSPLDVKEELLIDLSARPLLAAKDNRSAIDKIYKLYSEFHPNL